MLWYDSREWRPRPYLKSVHEPRRLPDAAVERLRALTGDLIQPGDPGYDDARRSVNAAYDNYPSAIIMCDDADDVALSLSVAKDFDFPAVARSSGHNTAGYACMTDGITIDVSRINHVELSTGLDRVRVGTGCDFAHLNAKLEAAGRHVPGGACPDVCVGGYMQGGGYGFTARLWGLNCDQVTAVTVMKVDGTIVRADAGFETELFKAVRGGTGSNFGVLLEVEYKLRDVYMYSGYSVRWTLSEGDCAASRALTWLQENFMKSEASKDLSYQFIWYFEGKPDEAKTPVFVMRGTYPGPMEDIEGKLADVLALDGAELEYAHPKTTYSTMNKILLTSPFPVPPFPPDIKHVPPELKVSRIIDKVLSPDDWQSLIDVFLSGSNPYTVAAMEVYGNAIDHNPDTAFDHRAAYGDLFFDCFWMSEDEKPKAEALLQRWKATVEPHWSGQVYQNYPAPDDPDYVSEYWSAETYALLQKVKRDVDPGNVLRYPQSVELPTTH